VLRTRGVISVHVTTGVRSGIEMDTTLQLIMEQFGKMSAELKSYMSAGQEEIKNYISDIQKRNKYQH
jgi:hypothetical protein